MQSGVADPYQLGAAFYLRDMRTVAVAAAVPPRLRTNCRVEMPRTKGRTCRSLQVPDPILGVTTRDE